MMPGSRGRDLQIHRQVPVPRQQRFHTVNYATPDYPRLRGDNGVSDSGEGFFLGDY